MVDNPDVTVPALLDRFGPAQVVALPGRFGQRGYVGTPTLPG